MKDLDEEMRKKLRELAQSEPAALDLFARQRVLARVREQTSRSRSLWLSRIVLAVAFVLAIVWGSRMRDGGLAADEVLPPATGAPRVVAVPEERSGSDEVAAARACADAPLPEPRAGTFRAGRRTIDLPGRARFVLFGNGTHADLERDACRTVLSLHGPGRVLVHAEDLMGGELVVRTPAGDVVVHGTVFDVRIDRRARLAVAVAEGEVGVGETRVAAGHALARDGDDERVTALRADEVRALLDIVRDPASHAPARATAVAEPAEPVTPPRGEVTGGVPMVHEPNWSN